MSNQPKNLWWGLPKNFDDRKNERKISWLELFYDLVYVAAIGQLTHHVSNHLSWQNTAFSFLLFSMLFWSWVNGSQYYDLHGNEGIRTRLFTFFQMLAVAAVAANIPSAFEGEQTGFAIAFAVIQIIITYLWWSVGIYDPSHRVFNIFYTTNYLIAFVLIIISLFTDYPTAIILWIIILFLDLTPSLIGAKRIVSILKQRGQVFTASATLVERFGLFTIIVLAESILGTVTSIVESEHKQTAAWIAFIFAIFIAFLLWSLYFDMTSEQETKKGYAYMQWFIFLHFPLLVALSLVGACIKELLTSMETSITTEWIFCISVATILMMIVGIARIMKEEEEDRAYIRPVSRILFITGLAMLVIPLFGSYLNVDLFMGLVAIVLVGPVIIGIRSWVRYKYFGEKGTGVRNQDAGQV